MTSPICPECVTGKHRSCDGNAWDFERDVIAVCVCPKENHPEPVGDHLPSDSGGVIEYVGWGGKIAKVSSDFNMGYGHYRRVPAYGIRRAIWDAAYGYVNGFPKRAIAYYVLTRSLNSWICKIAINREGVEHARWFGSVPLP